eukprot:TRINITY_DN4386_c1_g2_i1.p1 TRINITY_DN4386_c1_g2~~TRINITY_DN4386_c1_g2_i1.p1  ORF type:complete len:441 (+),score=138.84 TRINITY_DN4386_c1_g2_i1:74-1396(+)
MENSEKQNLEESDEKIALEAQLQEYTKEEVKKDTKEEDGAEEDQEDQDEDEEQNDAEEEEEEDLNTAEQDFGEGKRLMTEAQSLKTLSTSSMSKAELFDEAIGFFERALQKKVEMCGEMADECGVFYYHYGNAILTKLENTSDIMGQSIEIDQKETDDGQANPQDTSIGNSITAASEPEDDFSAAWELFEVARSIFSKNPAFELQLFETYVRLGDLSKEQGNPSQAIHDYEEALAIGSRLANANPSIKRDLAHINFSIGLIYELYEDQLSTNSRERFIFHYQEACGIFNELIRNRIEVLSPGALLAIEGDSSKQARGSIPSSAVHELEQKLSADDASLKELCEIRDDLQGKLEETEEAAQAKALLKRIGEEQSSGFAAPMLSAAPQNLGVLSGRDASGSGSGSGSGSSTPQMIVPKRKAAQANSDGAEQKRQRPSEPNQE